MLLPAKNFVGFKLRAQDGDMGKAHDFLFDDHHWVIRYLVADTGGGFLGREILIPPEALQPVDVPGRFLPVGLTKDQIKNGLPVESHQPVSRQLDSRYPSCYAFPFDADAFSPWGLNLSFLMGPPDHRTGGRLQEAGDPHLKSTGDVVGHRIQARDGEWGQVEDFIINEETWTIRYLVVTTGSRRGGKRILVSSQRINGMDEDRSTVFVSHTVEALKNSPEYTAESLNQDYEARLYHHYYRRSLGMDRLVSTAADN